MPDYRRYRVPGRTFFYGELFGATAGHLGSAYRCVARCGAGSQTGAAFSHLSGSVNKDPGFAGGYLPVGPRLITMVHSVKKALIMRTIPPSNPVLTSACTGFLLTLLYGLLFYIYRTLYVSNLLIYYLNGAIWMRVALLEYAMTAIGLLIGAQLHGAKWWAGGLVLLANSLILPWLAVVLSEDVYMAPGYGVLFFLPFWLSLRLFVCQVLGLLLMVAKGHYRSLILAI